MAQATLTIDLNAIAANWRALDALSGQGTETGAVLKADAYGLGLDKVAPVLAAAGARSFFVALAEEGAALRQTLGPGPRIFVFSGHMAGDAPKLRDAELIPLLNDAVQLRRHKDALPLGPYGLQIDTGMNRLGFEPPELVTGALPAPPTLLISHLACADTPDNPANALQRGVFEDLPRIGCPRSLSATGGTMLGASFHYDLTRPGIGLFGGMPFAAARPVVRLSLPVIQTRSVAVGEFVGYGADWHAETPRRIATLSSGYADGLIRALGGKAMLWAADRPCPVVGRVSMDLLTADVTDLPEVPATLDIIGPHAGIDALAAAAGTIGYEILTSLGARYQRVYINP
ncbi:MAG: alanine racemase [Pseudomonadota bacterium]